MNKTAILAALLMSFSSAARTCPVPETVVAKPDQAADIVAKTPRYTQGLIYQEGVLYESSGLYGQSGLLAIDPGTAKEKPLNALPDVLFGEGLAALDGKFYQLTWKARVALVYSADKSPGKSLGSFMGTKAYAGEGWGLASHKGLLAKSDGGAVIEFLDPQTFDVIDFVEVRTENVPTTGLNELESARGMLWANLYSGHEAVVINPENGCVLIRLDLSRLFERALPSPDSLGPLPSDTVANGIAYDPRKDRVYLTGKGWPLIFVYELKHLL